MRLRRRTFDLLGGPFLVSRTRSVVLSVVFPRSTPVDTEKLVVLLPVTVTSEYSSTDKVEMWVDDIGVDATGDCIGKGSPLPPSLQILTRFLMVFND